MRAVLSRWESVAGLTGFGEDGEGGFDVGMDVGEQDLISAGGDGRQRQFSAGRDVAIEVRSRRDGKRGNARRQHPFPSPLVENGVDAFHRLMYAPRASRLVL